MPERRIGYPGGLFALLWKEGKTIEQQKNRFTDAEMEIAKETDLPDLLESLGYQVRRVGSYHTTKEMDSLRIKNRRTWFRYSEGVGGDAITFLQRFCGIYPYLDLTDVRPAAADAALAELFQVPMGTPLLNMEEVDYDIDGRPVFCSSEYFVDGIFRHTVMRKKL